MPRCVSAIPRRWPQENGDGDDDGDGGDVGGGDDLVQFQDCGGDDDDIGVVLVQFQEYYDNNDYGIY